MLPEIELLGVTNFNWTSFRGTMDMTLKLRPDVIINKFPIDLSDDAKVLLNVAAYYGWSIDNPLHTLRNIAPLFMDFLTYHFMIACDEYTWNEFNTSVNIQVIKREVDTGLLLLTTGTLYNWQQTILTNLLRDWEYSHNTRVLFDKLLLFFERERGLGILFEGYRKKILQDQTFLLEKK
jgi:hypothetical protein